jgi:RNA polymerase sigma factor (TIGR02999 family)
VESKAPEDDAAFEQVYRELRSLARAYLAGERTGHTLQATALVHEAYLRLQRSDEAQLDAATLHRSAARAMRRVLIDHARGRKRLKRGRAFAQLPFDALELATSDRLDEVMAVDESIEKLAAQDEGLAELVRLRFYAGLDVDECATALGRSRRTVHRDWSYAKAWLHRALADGEAG